MPPKWTEPTPRVNVEARTAQLGDLHLSVRAQTDGERVYQSLMIHAGRFSHRTTAACMAAWPREAIALARETLDKIESELDAGEA